MPIIIQRAFKKPGLIDRAKTYYVELNDKGLYLIATGNATVMPRTRTMLQQAVANAAVDHFKNKYEVEIVANEQRIRNGEIDQLASGKMCHFLPKAQVELFKVSQENSDTIKVEIRGGKAKLNLQVETGYWDELKEIENLLAKV